LSSLERKCILLFKKTVLDSLFSRTIRIWYNTIILTKKYDKLSFSDWQLYLQISKDAILKQGSIRLLKSYSSHNKILYRSGEATTFCHHRFHSKTPYLSGDAVTSYNHTARTSRHHTEEVMHSLLVIRDIIMRRYTKVGMQSPLTRWGIYL